MENGNHLRVTLKSTLIVATVLLLLEIGTGVIAATEPGTVGAGFAQLFSEDQDNHRGELVVMVVRDGSPAAKAGIQVGDVVSKVNGADVAGRVFAELNRKELRGPVGTTLKLSLQSSFDRKDDGGRADPRSLPDP